MSERRRKMSLNCIKQWGKEQFFCAELFRLKLCVIYSVSNLGFCLKSCLFSTGLPVNWHKVWIFILKNIISKVSSRLKCFTCL